MQVTMRLTPSLEAYIDGLVASGRFASRDAAICESVALLEQRESKLADLDEALLRGVASADQGLLLDADAVFDQLIARYSPTGSTT
jgi:antitoxin ParD1/3/4